MGRWRPVLKFVNHSATALEIAISHGWLPGARYTNLRDVRRFQKLGFLDIDWKRYDFVKHLEITSIARPIMTVACDVEHRRDLKRVVDQAYRLMEFSRYVVVVPKDRLLESKLGNSIPAEFLLGFSVPTRYGGARMRGAMRKHGRFAGSSIAEDLRALVRIGHVAPWVKFLNVTRVPTPGRNPRRRRPGRNGRLCGANTSRPFSATGPGERLRSSSLIAGMHRFLPRRECARRIGP
jgi:hypothetical protein